ncbi:MAG: hypothetical protein KJ771_08710 [Nanoarchaeota archaeon]|nr:hypothetical protein [Nanoarchaeota archaeon]
MMIGLDRSFKPEWVYKILKLSKPGQKYKDLEPEFNSIIEIDGLKSKKNIMTIIRRYYLRLYRKNGEEFFDKNHLYWLSIKYSFDTIKPLLLFILLCRCDIAKFIQEKINLKYLHNGHLDRQALYISAMQKYGDRRVVKYAVGYYLRILQDFDILDPNKKGYVWLNKKVDCPSYLLKEMVLLYGAYLNLKEINVQTMINSTPFTYITTSGIEDVLREYNSSEWAYQKRLNATKIIIKRNIDA